jgi:hypothetical protein
MRVLRALLTLPLTRLAALTGWSGLETFAFRVLCATGGEEEAAALAAAMMAVAENEAGARYFLDHVVPEEIRGEAWAFFQETSLA